ncbi:phage tail protein [Limosilactobacillus caecicola]|uniref:phage tail protein n=1 Tax=Limosilactobacillus caecicola TaxID=2941332 RepID=UPI0023AA6301|nr:phage tail protein [Limosilactobacillus caecicola]
MGLTLITPHKETVKEPISKIILWPTMHEQWENNSTYQIEFTVIDKGTELYDQLDVESSIFLDSQEYVVKNCIENFDTHTKQITAWHVYNEISRIYVRADLNKQELQTDQHQQDDGVKHEKTYALKDILAMYLDNNKLGFTYEIHGQFDNQPVQNIDSGSGKEMLSKICQAWPEIVISPDNKKINIYKDTDFFKDQGRILNFPSDLKSMKTTRDSKDIINQIRCVGAKHNVQYSSTGGSLDSAEGFAKSPINANFGVNKDQMLQDFANRDVRVRAWGVDVNRLYDTIKNAGVSPEWFMAYDLQEGNPTSYSWLNHYANHLGDPYADASRVCDWIKSIANSDGFTPASYGGQGVDGGTASKWSQEYGKGTIGRLYLQATAAAAWEMAGINGGRYGKPIQGCVNQIKSWGGHTVVGGQKLDAFLEQWVGKAPYVLGGNDPSTGWDCSGLVNYTFKHFGIPLPSARPVTTTLETMGPVVGPPYQPGDLLFWGARGNSYHVSVAINSDWRIGADNERDGTVKMRIAQWPPDFAVRVPQMQQLINDGGSGGSYEAYYFPPFIVQDDASIKEWGEHPGPDLVDERFTDPEAMRKYALTTLKPNPSLTIEVSIKDKTFVPQKGEILRVQAQIKKYAGSWRTVGYDYYRRGGTSLTSITLNNTKQTILDYQNQRTNIIQQAVSDQKQRLQGAISSLDRQSQTLTQVFNTQNEAKDSQIPKLSEEGMNELKQLSGAGG